MSLSLFVLALYVFLQSSPAFGWFSVDPKFTAFVGLLFVAVVVLEAIFSGAPWYPRFFKRG
jgi:hypothetical protein